MTGEIETWIAVALIVMARVSAFMAVLPFVSAARVPQTIRAVVALGIGLAITPVLHAGIAPTVATLGEPALLAAIAGEIGTGLLLGLLVRVFFLALSFAAEFLAHLVGYAGLLVPSVSEGETTLALADLVVLFVTVLFLANDLHLAVIDGLVRSFDAIPVGRPLDGGSLIRHLVATLNDAFFVAMQLAGPFLLYVFICNVLLGIANRLVPQVPIQLVAAPLVLIGGLALALLVVTIEGDLFIRGLAAWIEAQ